MELIEAFGRGEVEGVERIGSVINTQISKVFVGKERVYKVYVKKKFFFKDLGDFKSRKLFYHRDFSWNHKMSPHIYLHLRPVKWGDGKFIIVSDDEAEDYFIEMSLADVNSSVSNLVLSGKLSLANVKKLASVLSVKIEGLTREKRDELSEISQSWYELWKWRLEDLESFASGQSFVSADLIKGALLVLSRNIGDLDYFKEYSSKDLSVSIDCHSDNILLSNGQINFIDILPVKESWRLIDPHFDVCRLGVDIEALGQPELVSGLYNSSSHNPYNIPAGVRMSYELAAATIKGVYYAIIGRKDLSEKYIPLIERLARSLEK